MSQGNHQRDCEVEDGAASGIVPAGAPDWITQELIQATIRVWQPYYTEILSPEEAVALIRSVGRLFKALSSGASP